MIGVIQNITVSFLLKKKNEINENFLFKNGVCTVHFPYQDRRAVILIEQMELVTPKKMIKLFNCHLSIFLFFIVHYHVFQFIE
jgi:hypothetical protein